MSSVSFAHTILDFLLDCEARNLSPNTIRFYRDELTRWGGQDVQAYLRGIVQRGGKPHCAARAIRVFMRRDGIAGQTFAIPRQTEPHRPCPTEQEVDRLRKAARSPRERAALGLLIDTGLRRSEAAGAAWQALDSNTGALLIRGKGGRFRTVFVGPRTRQALLRLRRRDDRLLGLSSTGLRSLLKRLGERAGIRLTAHSLRRYHATMMLRSGADLVTLSRLMGHRSITTTALYARLDTEDLRRAAEKGWR
jgi:integrase/recombinase XerD